MTRTTRRSKPSSSVRRRNAPALRIAKGARGKSPFASIEEAITVIRAGGQVIVVDDEDRENEGDLTIAAERVTPELVNFMTTDPRQRDIKRQRAARLELHAKISSWRKREALRRTLRERPDLMAAAQLDDEERRLLEELRDEGANHEAAKRLSPLRELCSTLRTPQ